MAQGSVQPLISEKNRQMTELRDQLGRLQMQQKELAEEKVQCQRDAESGGNRKNTCSCEMVHGIIFSGRGYRGAAKYE